MKPGPSPLRGRRVLVVEDDYLIASDMVDLLHRAGAATAGPVGRVQEALALLRAEPGTLDLAVLDMDLHGEPSHAVADALAALGVPFVLTTGFSAHALHPAYRGCARVEKPINERALLAALAVGVSGVPFPKPLLIPS